MSYRVLIVDDSSVVRSMVKKAVSMAGLDVEEVHEACNGREALDKLQSHWVDIVFTDLHMPEMTGIELVEAMARSGVLATTPVVVVSSDPSETRVEELRRLGVRAYLKKPFRPEGFRAIVEEVLHGPKEESHAG
ncbi:MAG TPA: response regulator [Anaeromyxobacteraceae bacterium]|nr:response regulator [Anaeromyxobacteraceae bacterium]